MPRTSAWIDPVTNVIRPRGVSLRRDFGSFVSGPWPARMVQGFLHELTHHWCFHSELGTALALLRFRALRRLSEGGGPDDTKSLFDEMLSVDIALRVLRPISEGLALFAEYDMAPGDSRIITPPMTWAAIALFGPEAVPNLDNPLQAEALRERLFDLRLQTGSIERKMSFLTRPLSELDDAYFDGYLMVKRIHADLRRRVPAFADSDLFLSYLRTYVFEDKGMVAILLREYENPFHRVVDVLEHLGRRLELLDEGDLKPDVAAYESAVSAKRPDGEHLFEVPGLRLSEAERSEGLRLLHAATAELEDDPGVPETARNIRNVQRGWLTRRSIAHVAVEPAWVKVKNGIVSAWPDPRDHEFPFVTAAKGREGVKDTPENTLGWVSVLMQPVTGFYAPVVGIGSEAVAVLRGGRRVAEIEAALTDPAFSPGIIDEETKAVNDWVNGYFHHAPEAWQERIGVARQSTHRHLRRIADTFLARWGDADELATQLRSGDRLLDVFSGDRAMFEASLALGILHDDDVLLPSTSAALNKMGWDVGAALRAAWDIKKRIGLQLFWNDEGVFRWLI